MGLVLKVRGQETSKIKIAWGDDQWDPPTYSVSRGLVSAAATKVRLVLNQISEEYMRQPNPDYSPFLTDLAQAGADLSSELFDAIDGDRQTAIDAKALIAQTTTRRPLTIHSDASIHVPWGFVFLGDPDAMPAPTRTIADFSDFWLERYSISTRFNPCNLMPNTARPRANFRILLALHKGLHERAQEHIPHERKECFQRIQRYQVGVVAEWELCRRKWREISKQDSVLYVYGHSDGTSIELDPAIDPNPKMEAVRFHNFFRKADASSASIFFLNGCVTGSGQDHDGFLRVTSMPGFYGFIGTEANVPNKFASEYGIDFMHHLCELGLSVQESYDKLRISHFPLSLLYSCFAHPHFRVEPVPKTLCNAGEPCDVHAS
jgi:hypothetical protein